MIYLWITLALLAGGGIFIGIRASKKKPDEDKDKKAHKLVFEIGPITLQ